jgi:hypothetical protein
VSEDLLDDLTIQWIRWIQVVMKTWTTAVLAMSYTVTAAQTLLMMINMCPNLTEIKAGKSVIEQIIR